MSTLNVGSIQSLVATKCPVVKDSNGTEFGTFCNAFVNFNGTVTVSGNCDIRDSFNVSSVTDVGTGNYTVVFTNAMPSADYAAVANGSQLVDGIANYDVAHVHTHTTASVKVELFGSADNPSTNHDGALMSVAIFGNRS